MDASDTATFTLAVSYFSGKEFVVNHSGAASASAPLFNLSLRPLSGEELEDIASAGFNEFGVEDHGWLLALLAGGRS